MPLFSDGADIDLLLAEKQMDPQHEQLVKFKVRCRDAADEIFKLALEEFVRYDNPVNSNTPTEFEGCASAICWEELSKRIEDFLTTAKPKEQKSENLNPLKMSNEEARRFGQTQTIPFGQFQGTKVDSVPLERLIWYADQGFIDQLRRYLRSDRIQQELQT